MLTQFTCSFYIRYNYPFGTNFTIDCVFLLFLQKWWLNGTDRTIFSTCRREYGFCCQYAVTYIYVYIDMYIHVTHIHVCVYIHTCIHTHLHACIHKYTYAYIHFCLFVVLRPSNILRSYQDGYRLVTVHTHDDFIVLPHWETRPPAP